MQKILFTIAFQTDFFKKSAPDIFLDKFFFRLPHSAYHKLRRDPFFILEDDPQFLIFSAASAASSAEAFRNATTVFSEEAPSSSENGISSWTGIYSVRPSRLRDSTADSFPVRLFSFPSKARISPPSTKHLSSSDTTAELLLLRNASFR